MVHAVSEVYFLLGEAFLHAGEHEILKKAKCPEYLVKFSILAKYSLSCLMINLTY